MIEPDPLPALIAAIEELIVHVGQGQYVSRCALAATIEALATLKGATKP